MGHCTPAPGPAPHLDPVVAAVEVIVGGLQVILRGAQHQRGVCWALEYMCPQTPGVVSVVTPGGGHGRADHSTDAAQLASTHRLLVTGPPGPEAPTGHGGIRHQDHRHHVT